MKRSFLKWFFPVLLLLTVADGTTLAAEGLPEILVSFEGGTITREQMVKRVHQNDPAVKENSGGFRVLLRQYVDEELYRIALRRYLREAGFPPSAEMAYACLQQLYRAWPKPMKRPSDAELKKNAADPDLQLLLAGLRYLRQTKPETLHVTETQMEDFYREQQDLFRRPASVQAEVLRTAPTPAGRTAITAAAARILQGEDFSRVAADTPERLDTPIPEETIARLGAGLKEGAVGKVTELPSGYVLIRVVRHVPEGYYSLAEARGYIQQELVALRAAKELHRIVASQLPEMKVQYHF